MLRRSRTGAALSNSAYSGRHGPLSFREVQSAFCFGKSIAPEEIMASLKEIQEQLKGDVDAYSGFGFTPLKLDQISYRLSTWWPDEKKHPCKNDQTCGEFFLKSRMRDLRTLLGWTITALLLSVGAPFWQDTLESLFGVKSLLRKRSDKQNVETESGAGNPKT